MSAEPFFHRDRKLPFAKTAANGRDGWIPVIRGHPLGRQGCADSGHRKEAVKAAGFGHRGRHTSIGDNGRTHNTLVIRTHSWPSFTHCSLTIVRRAVSRYPSRS